MFIPVQQEIILNGRGGAVADFMSRHRWDSGYARPYFDNKGIPCVTVDTGRREFVKNAQGQLVLNREGVAVQRPVYESVPLAELRGKGFDSPVWNATTLRKEEWIRFDSVVIREARQRLRAWSDLAAANTYSGFDGMATKILEHETMSDPGFARVDMDPTDDNAADRPLFQLEGIPLPVTHAGWTFSERDMASSRNTGMPLSTTMPEACGRRVAETIEKTTIGVLAGLTYGGGSSTPTYGRASTVFGYTNFTNRNTYTSITTPTGANPNATVSNVLAMRDVLYGDNFFGPFMLYHSTDWDQYMDNDYAFTNGSNWATNPNTTLRNRLRQIEGISDVRRLDFMTPTALGSTFNLLLVSMSSEVARAVIGMNIQTIQWETMGGLRKHFKVMAIMVPQLRADYSGRCGICHGTPA